MDREQLISRDRMRYSKNKFSASMCYLAILFNAIYFASIYRGVEENIGDYYFNILMGVSVLINIGFMLVTFLASEGVKNYKLNFAIVMLVVAAIQIIRIFGYPMNAHSTVNENDITKTAMIMGTSQFILCLVLLIASAACLVAGGVVGILKTTKLNLHNKYVEDNGGKLNFEEEDNNVPLVEATTNTNLDASVMGEEPIKSEKDD